MQQPPEHHVYFAAYDFGDDPNVITRIMGVEPTRAWVKGDPISGSKSGRQPHSRWALQSALPLAEPIPDHFEDLLPRLESRREQVVAVCDRFNVRLSVAAYLYEVNPGFALSASIVNRIAALGLELEFDLYCLHEVGESDPRSTR